ncbi:carbohydrate kinase family protein [Nocardioides mangrovicus]|uniref:Carbohydrate kinase family protein n=1 Tax=Nocardioides mangrovicus TaxID=2478913 RepID=A0A3L8P079_9ACTN|nr:carbohydrate kinase family protein [Nocardioides mangrovicus]RLV48302.1 carbohydrate kinase family protein [Nocardioides mangrovicus]
MTKTLLFAGEVFCDLLLTDIALPEAGGETFASDFAISPGGVANRAVAAARAGAPTRLLSRLGDDPLGRELRMMLESEPGLRCSWLETPEGWQTPVSVCLASPENRSFLTYREEPRPLSPPEDIGPVAAVHVGLAGGPLPEWVARLRAAGATVVGGVGWDATGEWSGDVLDRLAGVDVFVPNDVEAMRYTRTESPLAAARTLAERVPLVLVTRGADGVIAVDSRTDRVLRVPAVPVDVVDPTGAGDVFVATFMAAHSAGDGDLESQIRLAGLAASVSVTGLGGARSAPTRADLLEFLRTHPVDGDWTFLQQIGES